MNYDLLAALEEKNINSTAYVIAMEEGIFDTITSGILNTVQNTSKLISRKRSVLVDLLYSVGTLSEPKEIKKFLHKSNKIIDTVPYMDVADVLVPNFVGLQTDLKTLTKLVENYSVVVDKKAFKALDHIDTVISNFIGDEQTRTSFKQDKEITLLDDEFNKPFKKELQAMFDPKDKSETVKLSKLFKSNSDLKDTLTMLVKIDNSINDKDLLKLNKQVEKIKKKSDILLKLLESGEVKASKDALNNLVKSLDTTANFLTNLSNLWYTYSTIMNLALKVKEIYETA